MSEIDQSKVVDFPGLYLHEGNIPVIEDFYPKEGLDQQRQMELYPDDTILIGYPKSGTTWLQEVVWLIQNDLDFEGSKARCVWDRIPEIELIHPVKKDVLTVNIVKEMARPRFFKTHMPFWFMEKEFKAKKPKIIVIMRNPKDQMVSYYHMCKGVYPILMTEFANMFATFQAKKLLMGDCFEHNLSYWKYRDQPNFLFLKYEDLKETPHREFKKIASFIGKSLSDEDLQRLVDATTFDAMKKNPGTNLNQVEWLDQSKTKFQRKGMVGDWKNYFTEEQSQYIDKKCKEELHPVGLEFRFSL